MKILQIRFKNLNALYGEWHIDLTEPTYQDAGIFAITGPTGSGKSTLLDAVCLALYGETPRLGKITKSKNDIMSRQTGECYAEVLFETEKGRFICQFSQRRAKKSPTGALQEPFHHLADAEGHLIENKRNLVGKAIIDTTGMDFQRFTRSMMLAQGGFDSFLKASDDDKSKILQQITASGLYSDISKQVFLNHKEAKNTYERLLLSAKDLSLLDDAALNQLIQDKNLVEGALGDLMNALETKKSQRDWFIQEEKLKDEITRLNAEVLVAINKKNAFLANDHIIINAEKAHAIQDKHATFVHYRTRLNEKTQEIDRLKQLTPELESQLKQHTQSLDSHAQSIEAAEQALLRQLPIFEEVIVLDNEISQLDKQINHMTSLLAQEERKRKQRLDNKQALEQAIASNQTKLSQSRQFMSEIGVTLDTMMPHWSSLMLQLSSITKLSLQYKNYADDFNKTQTLITNNNTALSALLSTQQTIQLEINRLGEQQDKLTKAIELLVQHQTIEQLQSEKAKLTKSLYYIDTVANLAAHRDKLHEDEPCPLCGSITHPYAAELTIQEDKLSTEKAIKALEDTLAKVESHKKALAELSLLAQEQNNRQLKTQLEQDKLKQTSDTLLQKLAEIEKLQIQNQKESYELKQSVDNLLMSIELNTTEYSIEALTVKLTELKAQYDEHQSILKAGDNQLVLLHSELSNLTVSIEEQLNYLSQSNRQLSELNTQRHNKTQKRITLFSDKNPKTEKDTLDKALTVSRDKQATLLHTHQQYTEQLAINRSLIKSLDAEIDLLKNNMTQAHQIFLAACLDVGFNDAEAFKKACISSEILTALKKEKKTLDENLLSLSTLLQKSENQLNQHQALQQCELTLDALLRDIETIEQNINTTRRKQIEIETKINQDKLAREKMGTLSVEIEHAKSTLNQHEKLNLLIGSADGKKFRHFAQGITFEILVMHANQQLCKMTDRYLLIRDDAHPLALNVIDNYQAGEIRTINNLSGGESFIMSLALALGLSQMSSQKTRVDSLFLDEGFGTLDEEALDVALDALSSLHQDNKLIGIISHVPQLKNRITTQINIDAGHGGRSKINGPGCEQIPS